MMIENEQKDDETRSIYEETRLSGVNNGATSDAYRLQDSTGLKAYRDNLQLELESAIENGEAADIIRINNLLQELPVFIRAAEAKEIRQRLTQIAEDIHQLKEDEVALENLRAIRNSALAEKILAVEKAQIDASLVSASLFNVDNSRAILLDTRRTETERLKVLIAKNREVLKSNET